MSSRVRIATVNRKKCLKGRLGIGTVASVLAGWIDRERRKGSEHDLLIGTVERRKRT